MKKIFAVVFILAAAFFVILASKDRSPSPSKDSAAPPLALASEWARVRASDVPQVAAGWGTPIRLAVSEDGMWEDSAFITSDGKALYFMYYPGDLLTAHRNGGPYLDDGDVYKSEKPFIAKQIVKKYFLSEDIFTAAGPMEASDGAMFYHSNRPVPGFPNNYLAHIYRNSTPLPFNNPNQQYNNPHYCEARDELWFDRDDTEIFVLKNAKRGNFAGMPQLAPFPINAPNLFAKDSQPFLAPDCNTMYFSSDRDHLQGGPFIYTSQRLREDMWGAPQIVVRSNVAVGEPTLTADGKLFFVQILRLARGASVQYTTNLFYTERR